MQSKAIETPLESLSPESLERACAEFRTSLGAWWAARTLFVVSQEDFDRDGPACGVVGQPIFDNSDNPYPDEGERLATACDLLANRAAALGIGAKPALLLSRSLRNCGYREVGNPIIVDAEVLADELEIHVERDRRRRAIAQTQEQAAAASNAGSIPPDAPRACHTEKKRRPSSGTEVSPRAAKARDSDAIKLAHKWDESGAAWTVTELAAALGCDRTQLTGKTAKGGRWRCPLFARYWEQKQREKQQRMVSLKATNRTAVVAEE